MSLQYKYIRLGVLISQNCLFVVNNLLHFICNSNDLKIWGVKYSNYDTLIYQKLVFSTFSVICVWR